MLLKQTQTSVETKLISEQIIEFRIKYNKISIMSHHFFNKFYSLLINLFSFVYFQGFIKYILGCLLPCEQCMIESDHWSYDRWSLDIAVSLLPSDRMSIAVSCWPFQADWGHYWPINTIETDWPLIQFMRTFILT